MPPLFYLFKGESCMDSFKSRIVQTCVMVEENFKKNEIICSFAVSNTRCTLGFTRTEKAKPKTLLVGDILDNEKSKAIDLVLRKEKGKSMFDEIVYGNQKSLSDYWSVIEPLVDKGHLKYLE